MTEKLDALYEVVVANPDDDGPRRVYADALLEAGDARGDFIRAQLDGHPSAELEKTASVEAWLQPLKQAGTVTTRRGFADVVHLRSPMKQLDTSAPAWRTVRVLARVEELEAAPAVLDAPQLANVREVHTLRPRLLDALGTKRRPWTSVSIDLTQRPHPSADTLGPFPSLEKLDLHAFDDDSTISVITLPSGFFAHTPRLRELELSVAAMASDTLAPLKALRSLELNGQASALELPPSLEALDLMHGSFPDMNFDACTKLEKLFAGSDSLALGPRIPSLRRAWLTVSAETPRALEGLTGLRHLDLFDSTLAPRMFASLEHLLSLELGYAKGLTAEHYEGLTSLQHLGGVWSDLTDFPPLPALLSFHCMAPARIASLAPLLRQAPHLEYLDLNRNSDSELYFSPSRPLREAAWKWLVHALRPTRVRVFSLFDGVSLVRRGSRWVLDVNRKTPMREAETVLDTVRALFDGASP